MSPLLYPVELRPRVGASLPPVGTYDDRGVFAREAAGAPDALGDALLLGSTPCRARLSGVRVLRPRQGLDPAGELELGVECAAPNATPQRLRIVLTKTVVHSEPLSSQPEEGIVLALENAANDLARLSSAELRQRGFESVDEGFWQRILVWDDVRKARTIEAALRPPVESGDLLLGFVCHASEDVGHASQVYDWLIKTGVKPWMAKRDVVGGQDWELAIEEAVRRSHLVLVLISTHSVTKEGYLQKELRVVLSVAQEKPDGVVFVVPIRLESCDVPPALRRLQYVDLFEPDGFNSLLRSLQTRAYQLGLKVPKGTENEVVPLTPQHWAEDLGLSNAAVATAEWLVRESKEGHPMDPMATIARLSNELKMPPARVEECVDELESAGLVTWHHRGTDDSLVWPEAALFWRADGALMGWRVEEDAVALARSVSDAGQDGISMEATATALKWPARRINPAADYLVANEIVRGSGPVTAQAELDALYHLTQGGRYHDGGRVGGERAERRDREHAPRPALDGGAEGRGPRGGGVLPEGPEPRQCGRAAGRGILTSYEHRRRSCPTTAARDGSPCRRSTWERKRPKVLVKSGY